MNINLLTLSHVAAATFFSIIFPLFSAAQEVKLTTPTFEEVNSKSYAADTTADAVLLYDYADITFAFDTAPNDSHFKMIKKRRQRIKILKPSALSRGIVQLPYYDGGQLSKTETIRGVEGSTYRIENGKVVEEKLSRKDQVNEKREGNYYAKQLSFPNVQVGSIIDLEYEQVTPFGVTINPRTWYFQHDIPTAWSEYRITIPSFFNYLMIYGGYLPLKVNENKSVNVEMGYTPFNTYGTAYRFVVENAPAFKNETYITTEDDYYTKIEFELSSYYLPDGTNQTFTKDWSDLDLTLLKNEAFGTQLHKAGFMKDEAGRFSKIADKNARMEAIYNYMLTTFSWDGDEVLGTSQNLRKVYTDKKGNATEINLLLYNLLNECDIEAYPVILSTRSHGRVNTMFPLINQFNYTIVGVPTGDKYTFMDITDKLIPFGGLPERCLNGKGRVIKQKGNSDFVEITMPFEYVKMETIKADFDLDVGELKGNYKLSTGGYLAHDLREEFKNSSEAELLKEFQKKADDWRLSNFSVSNKDDINQSLDIKFDFEQSDVAMPDMIYLDPMLVGKIEENPFKSKERIYPIDFGYRTKHTYVAEFAIPPGFVVEEIPSEMLISLPNLAARFAYRVTADETTIRVLSQFSMKQTVFYTEEYPNLKEFFSKIVEKHGEQVVLKKQ